MIKAPIRAVALVLSFVLGPLAGTSASAVEQPEVLRMRAEQLASGGDCQAALPLLARARAAAPQDARVLHAEGQCLIRVGRYADAVESLQAAKQVDASLPELDLHLAIAHFHNDDVDAAEAALADARRQLPGNAEVELYSGLVALERANDAEAAALLDRARAADRMTTEPMASYYGGLAWRRADDEERAREALDRVRRENPGSPWAQAAERALAETGALRGVRDRRDLEAKHQAERPLGSMAGLHEEQRWLLASGGIEYDDNVVLQGSGVTLPREISNEADHRYVYTLQGGAELVRTPDWIAGVFLSYYGSEHDDLDDFDVDYPALTLWADRKLDERSVLRVQYDFAYAWVGGERYLAEQRLTPAYFHTWEEDRGTTRVFAQISKQDYFFPAADQADGAPGGVAGDACPGMEVLCGPFGLSEFDERNRDGWGVVAGVGHTFAVEALDTELRVGYRYHYYEARGEEWDYRGHQIAVGSRTALPFELTLDLSASYTYKPYQNASTFPDPQDLVAFQQYPLAGVDKRENVFEFDAILERPITDWLIASIRYSHRENDSNRAIFDYERDIVGGFLTVRFAGVGG